MRGVGERGRQPEEEEEEGCGGGVGEQGGRLQGRQRRYLFRSRTVVGCAVSKQQLHTQRFVLFIFICTYMTFHPCPASRQQAVVETWTPRRPTDAGIESAGLLGAGRVEQWCWDVMSGSSALPPQAVWQRSLESNIRSSGCCRDVEAALELQGCQIKRSLTSPPPRHVRHTRHSSLFPIKAAGAQAESD